MVSGCLSTWSYAASGDIVYLEVCVHFLCPHSVMWEANAHNRKGRWVPM